MDLLTIAFLYFLHLNYWILWLIENDKASVVIRVCGWLEERDWAMTHILLAFYHSNDMRHETRLWASSVDIKVTPPAYSQLAWWSQWYCAQAGPQRKHLNTNFMCSIDSPRWPLSPDISADTEQIIACKTVLHHSQENQHSLFAEFD